MTVCVPPPGTEPKTVHFLKSPSFAWPLRALWEDGLWLLIGMQIRSRPCDLDLHGYRYLGPCNPPTEGGRDG